MKADIQNTDKVSSFSTRGKEENKEHPNKTAAHTIE